MKIKVDYSLDLDVWNYLHSIYSFTWLKHGRNNIQDKFFRSLPLKLQAELKKTKNREQAKKIIKNFLSSNLEQREKKYSIIGRKLMLAWEKHGSEIEEKLETIYKNKIPFESISLYLSSSPICPYNFKEKWILVFAEANTRQQLQILLHELNHFMFYYYFGDLRKELEKEKFELLKEALTIFTNPEEKGYPNQRKLRKWLIKQKKPVPDIIRSNNWRKYL